MLRGRRRYRDDYQSSAASSSSGDDYYGRPTRFRSHRARSRSIDIPIRNDRLGRSEFPLEYPIDPVERHRSTIYQRLRALGRDHRNPEPVMMEQPRLTDRERFQEELERRTLDLDRLEAARRNLIFRNPRPTNSENNDSSYYYISDSESINSNISHHCECCRHNVQSPPPYAAAEAAPTVPSVEQVEDYDDDIPDEPAVTREQVQESSLGGSVVPHNSDDTAVEVPDTRPALLSDVVEGEVDETPRNGKTSRFTEGDMS